METEVKPPDQHSSATEERSATRKQSIAPSKPPVHASTAPPPQGGAATAEHADNATAAPQRDLAQRPPTLQWLQGPCFDRYAAKRIAARCWRVMIANHLAIGLVAVIVFSCFVPEPGIWLDGGAGSKVPPNLIFDLCIVTVFFLNGLNLKLGEVWDGLKNWKASLYGIVSVLVITPLLGFAVVLIPLRPVGLVMGVGLFTLTPNNFTTSIIFTRTAKGNVALGIMISTVCSLLVSFTLPISVPLLFRLEQAEDPGSTRLQHDVAVKIDPLNIFLALLYLRLVPMVVGKAVSYIPRVKPFFQSKAFRPTPSVVVLVLVWLNVSRTADKLDRLTADVLIAAACLGVGLHVVYLLLNAAVCLLFRFPGYVARTLVLSCSGKALIVGITVLEVLPPSAGSKGMLIIGMILGQLGQIVIDSVLSNVLLERHKKREALPMPAQVPVA
ncbi:unnamed protein product [Vitrella brassicaformis CCMP3155]|uniref:Cation/H+ exchanger domain-containing protein n=3 Tax=Vitrella brassicaformis TaxID=1169539 RepID=A0A0G4EHK6_VITBC|nr:unnamed protein product [Vitrella brassicaformis CCMP3155]|mmetsp:Transcript_17677/g.50246  ORF Transcript_17677/g.50246 Transcript_17677/m.50246 type:complete len:441 (+) Transcript_17677:77-1399(+)|eukprot:CEL95665.1 unnamed protein product [Vitrella brassicaformis CCMP3155]